MSSSMYEVKRSSSSFSWFIGGWQLGQRCITTTYTSDSVSPKRSSEVKLIFSSFRVPKKKFSFPHCQCDTSQIKAKFSFDDGAFLRLKYCKCNSSFALYQDALLQREFSIPKVSFHYLDSLTLTLAVRITFTQSW